MTPKARGAVRSANNIFAAAAECSYARLTTVVASSIYAVAMWRTLGQPLVENHSFRQAQTAFVARNFAGSGIDIMHPIVPVFGMRSVLPFEMPWYQAVASLGIRFGLGEPMAMRLTALVCTLFTAYLIQALVTRLVDCQSGTVALCLYLFSPLTIVWGRTAMIESFTTAFTLAWIYLVLFPRGRRPIERNLWLVAGVTAGVIAWTSKSTTAGPWSLMLLPAFWQSTRLRQWRRLGELGVSAAIPAAAGLLWTRWADATKASNELTSWLTSKALRGFIYGSAGARLDSHKWLTIVRRVDSLILGRWGQQLLVGVAFVWLYATRRRGVALSLIGVPLIAVGTFFNLYVVHDYYLVAIAPAIWMLEGIGVVGLVRVLGIDRPIRPVMAARRAQSLRSQLLASEPKTLPLAVITATVVCATFLGGAYYARGAFDRHPSGPEGVADLVAWSTSEEGVVVSGHDWNPDLLFAAHRDGVMLRPPDVTSRVIKRSGQLRFMHALYAARLDPAAVDLLRNATVIAPVTEHFYRFSTGPTLASLAGRVAPFEFRPGVITDGDDLSKQSWRVPCEVSEPSGREAPLRRFSAEKWPGRRMTVRSYSASTFRLGSLAPLPAWDGIITVTESGFSQQRGISCTGPARSFVQLTATGSG